MNAAKRTHRPSAGRSYPCDVDAREAQSLRGSRQITRMGSAQASRTCATTERTTEGWRFATAVRWKGSTMTGQTITRASRKCDFRLGALRNQRGEPRQTPRRRSSQGRDRLTRWR
jgi:hypothetical protein